MAKQFQNGKKEKKKLKEMENIWANLGEKNKFIIKQQLIRKIKKLEDTKICN